MALGIALLGAGIFAQEEHLSAILSTPTLELKAVYSRSQKSAETLASVASKSSVSPALYFDTPANEDQGLTTLLSRPDIAAVVVCLPILAQPAIIKQCLAAGKHVISEKPIAKDVATAKELVTWYEALGEKKPIWAVAENFRFWKSLVYAAGKVRDVGGKVTTFGMEMYTFVKSGNKYFETGWRKTPEYQGGFLLDGGIHSIAGLRLLLGAAGQSVSLVSAFSALLEERLPPIDTVHGIARTAEGVTGTLGLSFGTEFKSGMEIEIVTTEGRVVWTPKEVRVTKRGKEEEEVEKFPEWDSGVKAEMVAFGESLVSGKGDKRQSPEEGLRDLVLLEGLFESGEKGGVAVKIAS